MEGSICKGTALELWNNVITVLQSIPCSKKKNGQWIVIVRYLFATEYWQVKTEHNCIMDQYSTPLQNDHFQVKTPTKEIHQGNCYSTKRHEVNITKKRLIYTWVSSTHFRIFIAVVTTVIEGIAFLLDVDTSLICTHKMCFSSTDVDWNKKGSSNRDHVYLQ